MIQAKISFVLLSLLVCQSVSSLKNVGIYYGYLSSLNSAVNNYENDKVISQLNKYDVFVIGDGIEKPTHQDYANTQYILSNLNPSVLVFGYVDIGNTFSHTQSEMQLSVDEWEDLRVEGIFLDEFGFDYWSSDSEMRARQNQIVSYVHSKGLKVFVNAWNPSDVFTKLSDNPCPISQGDYFLVESYVFSTASLDFAAEVARMEKIRAAKASHGIIAIGVSTTNQPISLYRQRQFDFMTVAAQVDELDGIGWGTESFSAQSGIMPFRSIKPSLKNLVFQGSISVNLSKKIITRKTLTGKVQLNYKTYRYSIS